MSLTRRDFLKWLAWLGATLVLPQVAPTDPVGSPPILPAAPTLAVPARRLWALDGTMLVAGLDPSGPLVTFTGPTLVCLEYFTTEDGWQDLTPVLSPANGALVARLPGEARSLRAICTPEGGLVFTAAGGANPPG
jgi:hypothetical protein